MEVEWPLYFCKALLHLFLDNFPFLEGVAMLCKYVSQQLHVSQGTVVKRIRDHMVANA